MVRVNGHVGGAGFGRSCHHYRRLSNGFLTIGGRVRYFGLGLLLLFICVWGVQSQSPIDVSAISITPAGEFGQVTITAANQAVPARAQLAVRNVYTNDIAYTNALSDGSFSVTIRGTPAMPYQIFAASSISDADRRNNILPDAPFVIVHRPAQAQFGQPYPFEVGGLLSYGGSVWFGLGRIGALALNTGNNVNMALDAILLTPDAPLDVDWHVSATVTLRPFASATAQQTRTELPISYIPPRDVPVGALQATNTQREGDTLLATLSGTLAIPPDMPVGVYHVMLAGQAQVDDSQPFDWVQNRVFSTAGTRPGDWQTMLPFTLQIGDATNRSFDNTILTTLNNPAPVTVTYGLNQAPLLLLPGTLPGTPFVVGDRPDGTLTLQPAYTALINGELLFVPLQGDPQITTFSGVAQRGYFVPDTPLPAFTQAGEYRLTFSGVYTDVDEVAQTFRWQTAGVVAADTPDAVAYGGRGLVGQTGNRQAWFDMMAYPHDDPFVLPIANRPYFAGDVAYLPDTADHRLQPTLQVADPTTGYAYITATRPDVLVRQYVQDLRADTTATSQWHNQEPLFGQVSAGAQGNREGDYVFLFGGAVFNDGIGDDVNATAGYAALAIVTDDRETLRVLPPFERPLFEVNDAPVDLFFHPTGTRAGQVYALGDELSLTGYIAPAVAADVTLTVRSPSGRRWTIDGRASRYGYFANRDAVIRLQEVGVWHVMVEATYQGATSYGLMPEPVTGGVLGMPRGAAFDIYVIDGDLPPLPGNEIVNTAEAAAQALNFSLQVPPDWTDAKVFYTVRTPSYVLQQGTLRISGNRVAYQYNPQTLARDFPNLETDTRPDGPAASDVVTLTVAITGTDSEGRAAIRTQTYTLLHDRLISVN